MSHSFLPSDPAIRHYLHTLQNTVSEFCMFRPGDRILVAVSGGADSVALVSGLHMLQSQLGIRIGMAHVHHGLRPGTADLDLAFTRDLALRLCLPFHETHVQVRPHADAAGLSVETAGRMLRYRFFQETAARHGYQKIATGHHADDNAEQVLMALIRGSGPEGLCGIPPVRENSIIRPQLRLDRKAILAFLEAAGQKFREDETNTDTTYERNRIRHTLLPVIEKGFNPEIRSALNRLSETMREENRFIETHLPVSLSMEPSQFPDTGFIDISRYQSLPRAIRRRWIRKHLHTLAPAARFSLKHTETVMRLFEGGTGREAHLPGNIRCTRLDSGVRVTREPHSLRQPVSPPPSPDWAIEMNRPDHLPVQIPVPGNELYFRFSEPPPFSGAIAKLPETAALIDFDRLPFPLTLRTPRPGDRFHPLGAPGSQKLSRYFKNVKFPAEQRNSVPLIMAGDQVIWACGHRISETVKITPETLRILKVEVLLA